MFPQVVAVRTYPETNGLLALAHRDKKSNTPAAKSVPVRITAVVPGLPVQDDLDVPDHGLNRSEAPETVPLA